ncbi:type II and III secretion system protein family protein [Tautonia plasticadhaerens]|uniref:Type II secretion system protein D n=1 Tax=Tautonia plasticadhaerens TaxID=2527974 RepID=A0A518H6S0_9BACT|nr:pilus assembly protein N-terminal domain-containing protein [Tautonia plasticadhaerens]QDV36567.1 Type II secretion system protein D precursor [Tautonia plasticadhaerens]
MFQPRRSTDRTQPGRGAGVLGIFLLAGLAGALASGPPGLVAQELGPGAGLPQEEVPTPPEPGAVFPQQGGPEGPEIPPPVMPPGAEPSVLIPPPGRPIGPRPDPSGPPTGGVIRFGPQGPPGPGAEEAGLPPAIAPPGGDAEEGEEETYPAPESGVLIEAVDLPAAEVELIIGRSRLFRLTRPLSADTVISYDNENIVEVQPLTNPQAEDLRFINVVGVGFGRATVRLIDQERNEVQTIEAVVAIDEKALERRIHTILPGADVTVLQVAQNVVLEGQVPNAKVMADVLELVRSELRLSGQTSVGSLAGSLGYGGGGGEAPPGGIGTPVPPSAASPAGAQPGLIVVNRVKVRGPRQVMLKVKIAEINRTGLRQLGVNFQRLTDGDNVASIIGSIAGVGQGGLEAEQLLFADPLDTQLFGIFDEGDFRLFLNALRQNDLARILAQPTLMTLDGQPARFLAGGSFPFPVPQISVGGVSTITIQFRDFGALLEFLPMILEDDTIRLDVQPVFSELNPATGVAVSGTAVPGLTERSARTVVQLREGQTLAIAGLFSTRTQGSTVRVPLLGDLPIVGPAFSKNTITTNETELLVLVTPELVEPLEEQAAPAPGELYQEPNDLEFFFLGRLEGKTRHPHRSTTNYLDPFHVMKHFRSEDQWVVGPHGFAD